jgi:hypothetical protein
MDLRNAPVDELPGDRDRNDLHRDVGLDPFHHRMARERIDLRPRERRGKAVQRAAEERVGAEPLGAFEPHDRAEHAASMVRGSGLLRAFVGDEVALERREVGRVFQRHDHA